MAMDDNSVGNTSILVTFGLTCYNQKDEIIEAIKSIMAINRPFSYEIIIGDDGSSDGSQEAVERFAIANKLNLKVLAKDNGGDFDSGTSEKIRRNKLRIVREASGRYCLMGDGDDEWCDTDFVKEAIAILDADHDISAVFHAYARLYPDGTRNVCFPLSKSGLVDSSYYIALNYYSHFGTFVFRTPIGNERMRFLSRGFDDVSLSYWCASVGNFYYSNKCVYNYRQYWHRGWEKLGPVVTNYLAALDEFGL